MNKYNKVLLIILLIFFCLCSLVRLFPTEFEINKNPITITDIAISVECRNCSIIFNETKLEPFEIYGNKTHTFVSYYVITSYWDVPEIDALFNNRSVSIDTTFNVNLTLSEPDKKFDFIFYPWMGNSYNHVYIKGWVIKIIIEDPFFIPVSILCDICS